jgi:probable phosphoglycerate mutase
MTGAAETGKTGPAPGLKLPQGVTLYLIRHGETDWNAEGRLQGGKDIPLNDFGRVQAEEAGHKLHALKPKAEDLAYLCSPMARARETMEIARQAIGLHPSSYRIDDRLRELTFGTWEGLTWREVRKLDPARAQQREQHKWAYAPPGGESYQMLLDRVTPVFSALERDTVVVSHGGVMRAVLAGLGLEPTRRAESLDIWQGRILVISDGRQAWH